LSWKQYYTVKVTGLLKDLRSADFDEMTRVAVGMNQPRFRGAQLFKWIHQSGVTSFDSMTNLPLEFREQIQREYYIDAPLIETQRQSALDGTVKLLLRFMDGMTAESVIMPHEEGSGKCTVCVSSQIGCAIGCSFCATGRMGFSRNLTVSEILSQVYLADEMGRQHQDSWHVSNVVYMGMGEPFLNYDTVLKSLRILIDPKGINIGQRRIVVSTSGYVPGIIKMAEEGLQVVLAVSLHSADNQLRDKLVPLNRKYPLESLAEACQYFNQKTGKRITFEYALIEDVNDSTAAADQLAGFVKPLSANVNIIPVNEVSHGDFKRSSKAQIFKFVKFLKDNGVEAVIRKERGSDIAGACGQLRSDTMNN
jgi:23S rRNA (adenine2503-C2)-methyltransferase